jgi:uncharacterized membrane protein
MNLYVWFKYAHLLTAIVALGTGAGIGMLVALSGDDATHGAFVLRAARKLTYVVVLPGYVLMLGTGMWMAHLGDLLDARWAEAAMNLWGVGALFIAFALAAMQRQSKLLESGGGASRAYRRAALLGRCFGAGAAAVILAILYYMVFKPA